MSEEDGTPDLLVPVDDPFRETVHGANDDGVVTMLQDIQHNLAILTEMHEVVRSEIQRRATLSGATTVTGHSHEVTIEKTHRWQYDFDVLDRLQEFLTPGEFADVVRTIPPKPEAPTRKADIRKLQALARKRGGVIGMIVEEGARRYQDGPPRLVITERKGTLTPRRVEHAPKTALE